jgi:hypothetical protein
MIDLPDHGYSSFKLRLIDPGGAVSGSLGGDDDIIPRPGIRYAIEFTTGLLSSVDAQIMQVRLEAGARDDVSYPWPLDVKPRVAGAPVVNGASPAGNVLPVKGLLPGYPFVEGQPLAVISGGLGYIHRVTVPLEADGAGNAVLTVLPWTRTTFNDLDVIEIERPRIRGLLQWDGPSQGNIGARPFTFTISERA